jgi:hypothetical protein
MSLIKVLVLSDDPLSMKAWAAREVEAGMRRAALHVDSQSQREMNPAACHAQEDWIRVEAPLSLRLRTDVTPLPEAGRLKKR